MRDGSITIESVTEKAQWERCVALFAEANFLQSWNWGEFHQSLGKQVYRFLAVENRNLVGICQVVREEAKRGTYLAVAGGPICNWHERADVLQVIVSHLKRIGNESNCVFIRLRPQQLDTQLVQEVAASCGMRIAPMHVTADLTLQLNLELSEQELLAQMRKNTRSAIRKAEQLGITVRLSTQQAEIKAFYKQQLVVAKRHNFIPFSEDFLTKQFAAFSQDNQVCLIHAEHENQLLATAFVIFYNKEAVYHYGVSTDHNAKLPGSYACQWAAILEAKRRGCSSYNFWGIAPENETNHRFAGVSLFKRGFGGQEVAYLPARDIPLNWRYSWVHVFELLRKRARKL